MLGHQVARRAVRGRRCQLSVERAVLALLAADGAPAPLSTGAEAASAS